MNTETNESGNVGRCQCDEPIPPSPYVYFGPHATHTPNYFSLKMCVRREITEVQGWFLFGRVGVPVMGVCSVPVDCVTSAAIPRRSANTQPPGRDTWSSKGCCFRMVLSLLNRGVVFTPLRRYWKIHGYLFLLVFLFLFGVVSIALNFDIVYWASFPKEDALTLEACSDLEGNEHISDPKRCTIKISLYMTLYG